MLGFMDLEIFWFPSKVLLKNKQKWLKTNTKTIKSSISI
jgi:hypothetical protein